MSVQAVLRILNGPQKGERLVFEEAREYQVGRKRECDLPVTDGYMSRVHFRITAEGDAFIVEDLGSSHGTLLNGRKLAGKTVLQDGDLIRAGQTDFVFQSGTEVRALGTSSKTVMGAPRTMFEPVQSSGDSVFASPRSERDPETAAAPLSPAQLAAMGAQPREESEDLASENHSGIEAPGMTSAAESVPAPESEPAAAAPDTSLSRSAFEELIAKKEDSNISENASDSKDDSSEDEWTSAWGDAPEPAKSEPSSESRQQSSDSPSSGPDRKDAAAQEDDLDWWPA